MLAEPARQPVQVGRWPTGLLEDTSSATQELLERRDLAVLLAPIVHAAMCAVMRLKSRKECCRFKTATDDRLTELVLMKGETVTPIVTGAGIDGRIR